MKFARDLLGPPARDFERAPALAGHGRGLHASPYGSRSEGRRAWPGAVMPGEADPL